jgi:hypothetical protein
MINILVQYLIKNGHLDLPSIGTLKCVKQESYWENNIFIAPNESVEFESINVVPTKHFYSFLADELNISIEQAALQLEQFINDFKSKNNSKLVFLNFGFLQYNDHLFTWHNTYDTTIYYKNLKLEVTEVNNQIDNNSNTKKDLWWVWALLVFILSASLIAYKYFSI